MDVGVNAKSDPVGPSHGATLAPSRATGSLKLHVIGHKQSFVVCLEEDRILSSRGLIASRSSTLFAVISGPVEAHPLSHWQSNAFSSRSESAVRFASRSIRRPFSSRASQSRLQEHDADFL